MINGKTRLFVLLGSPVEHSVSPAMHTAAFRALGLNAAYLPFRCDAADVPHLIGAITRAGGGGNLTVPHKTVAVSALDRAEPGALRTGACNTFWGHEGASHGDNTDVDGILAALDRLDAPASGWLVLGTGGSARAVLEAARQRGAAVAVESRSPERQSEFEARAASLGVPRAEAERCEVIINATPLGLSLEDPLPLVPARVPGAVVALDLVYAATGTRWSQTMAARGVRAADGREVLVAQGAASFRRWFPGEDPPVEVMRAVVEARLQPD